MKISTWTARAVVAVCGLCAGLVPSTPGPADAAEVVVPRGVLAVAEYYGLTLTDPEHPDFGAPVAGHVASVDWSLDGRRLLAVRNALGDAPDVIVTDPAGEGAVPIPLPAGVSPSTARWVGPDRLAVLDSASTLRTLDSDGSDAAVAAELPSGSRLLDGSPGEVLVAEQRETGQALVRIDLDDGGRTTLREEDGWDLVFATTSPDRQQIAYVTIAGLSVMASDGSDEQSLVTRGSTSADTFVGAAAWSPDGRQIAYEASRAVRTVDVVTGDRRDAFYGLAADLSWQPVGACTINGTDGPDELHGTPGDDVICAGDGDDTITGSAGNDVVLGGGGLDTLDLSAETESLVLDAARFVLTGPGRAEVLSVESVMAGSGDDVLRGTGRDDRLDGGPGDDLVHGGASGGDDLVGGSGTDTVSIAWDVPGLTRLVTDKAPETVDLTLGATTGAAPGSENDDLTGFENIAMGDQVGLAVGDAGPNVLSGTRAQFEGRGGDDVIRTDADSAEGLDAVDGGPGVDTLDLSGRARSLSATMADRPAERIRLTGFADRLTITGKKPVVVMAGGGADRVDLRESTGAATVHGGPGNDVIVDGAGDNHLFGDTGDDVIRLGAGDDTAYGGPGVDLLRFLTSSSPIRVDLARRSATGAAFGTDRVSGFDDVLGTGGRDVLLGTDGPETLRGGRGADLLRGRGGNDTLVTRDDVRDQAYGGAGRDTCVRDRYDQVFSCP